MQSALLKERNKRRKVGALPKSLTNQKEKNLLTSGLCIGSTQGTEVQLFQEQSRTIL